jgi:hypothetical protein
VVGLYVPAFFVAIKIATKKSSTAIPNAKRATYKTSKVLKTFEV